MWDSEHFQAIFQINRKNRAQLDMPHTGGTRSVAQTRQLFFEQHGRFPTELELYKLTHVQGSGERMNDTAAAHLAKMEVYIQGQSEEVQLDMYAVAESAVKEVIGNMDGHGRAYNAGLGAKAHNVRSTSTSSSSSTARSARKNKEQEQKAWEDSIMA